MNARIGTLDYSTSSENEKPLPPENILIFLRKLLENRAGIGSLPTKQKPAPRREDFVTDRDYESALAKYNTPWWENNGFPIEDSQ